MKTYFITYGNENYTNSKIRICNEAKSFGFDEVIAYGPESLDEEFIQTTKSYIHEAQGAGFWLFKPYILNKTFELMEEGDILVYADAGCSINIHGRETFDSYIKMLNDSDTGMIRLRYMNTPEEMYTNEYVFDFFECGFQYPRSEEEINRLRNSDVYMNGIIYFKKNTNSKNYIEDFLWIAENRPDLFSNEGNTSVCDRFKAHRHDQSISSCLVKLYNFIDIEDHTFENDYDGWMGLIHKYKTPILATRIRG